MWVQAYLGIIVCKGVSPNQKKLTVVNPGPAKLIFDFACPVH